MKTVNDPLALGKQLRTILRIELAMSRVTSSTLFLFASGILSKTVITFLASVPSIIATKEPFLLFPALLVTTV